MSMENSVRWIKKIHPTSVVLVKAGKFYQCLGKDAYIVAGMFDYKLRRDKYVSCGFPLSALNKVKVELEKEKVDYIVVDKRNEYEVICREEFKKENKYEEIFAIGKTKELIKRKAEKINKYIIENITNEEVVKKIKKLEEVLYEEW